MEMIRRKIKIFWVEHGSPILRYLVIILVFLGALRIINNIAVQRKEESMKIEQTVYTENKENTELINKFIHDCKELKTKEAYNLLSENCKNELYPSLEIFEKDYYQRVFEKSGEIKISYHSEDDTYTVTIYKNELETGKTNQIEKEDTYKIEREAFEDKIYINYKKFTK